MAKKETVSKVAELPSSSLLDKVMEGAAAFAIVALAWCEVLRHVSATQPINYLLAAGLVFFLLYLVFAPFFRR